MFPFLTTSRHEDVCFTYILLSLYRVSHCLTLQCSLQDTQRFHIVPSSMPPQKALSVKLQHISTINTSAEICTLPFTSSTVCPTALARAPSVATGRRGRLACVHTDMELVHALYRASCSTYG